MPILNPEKIQIDDTWHSGNMELFYYSCGKTLKYSPPETNNLID